jgi:hypothetical protein
MFEIAITLLILIFFVIILYIDERKVHFNKVPFSDNLFKDKSLQKD